MHKKSYSLLLGEKELVVEFNDLALHAHGSVMVSMGETVLLVTAVMSERAGSASYFPLSVEFEEKFYAAGRLLGSRFVRREGKPSDEAVLSARIIDRTIRPLFNQQIRHDVQVIASVLALGEEDPDVLGVIGASLALAVSDIPWDGPVGAVRIGQKRDTKEIIINPSYADRVEGNLLFEVLACGKSGTINMIETSAYEVPEADIVAVLEASRTIHTSLEEFQQNIVMQHGRPKRHLEIPITPQAVEEFFVTHFASRLRETIFSGQPGKQHINDLTNSFVTEVIATHSECSATLAESYFHDRINDELHRGALEESKRADGRDFDTVRPLYAQAGGVSPVLHGSGIFYRGETHVFTALTLGGPDSAQLVDTIETHELKKHYLHHYNFPPFSVGETGRVGGFNRRMIGHGALAEKALIPVIPSQANFPYTIRLVSETLSSNGSSSMASVCGSTLALMDGGVPITRPVAGIASGVMIDGERYALLTDIQGPEDEYGDMDFKVAGTELGVTAIQMDVKVGGVTVSILAEALEKARLARLHILETMKGAIATPRPTLSPRAPEIVSLSILPEQIGLVIGGGGKTINKIKDETGVDDITIEDSGVVYITGRQGSATEAAERIRAMTRVYVVGDRLSVTITKIADFGAFAKIDAFHEGLIHISEIASHRVENVHDVLKEGQEVPVIVSKVAEGKIGLSIKLADPNFIKAP
jgi:polyribonucleotide nucleotidyltransferase